MCTVSSMFTIHDLEDSLRKLYSHNRGCLNDICFNLVNVHFDSEWNIHMSSSNYEKSGYDHKIGCANHLALMILKKIANN